MKSFAALIAAGMLCLVAAGAQAQQSPFKLDGLFPPAAAAPSTMLDAEGLRSILSDLGYSPEKVPVNGITAFKISLQHSDGSRTTMVAIDAATGNVVVVGGGFASYPDVTRATAGWYRKLAKINNSISPRQIFVNDTDVLGLTSVKANVNLTATDVKKLIAEHIALFDQHLVPLAAELPSGAPVASR